jgi:ElaB/YqjD/DUF883 family membrane-anchored ribosome-binding protein
MANDMKTNVQNFKEQASEKAAELRDRASELGARASEQAAHAREVVSAKFGETRDYVTDGLHELDAQTRTFVKDHPFAAIGIAIGLGFAIGRLVRR